jgi:hypothetical protein
VALARPATFSYFAWGCFAKSNSVSLPPGSCPTAAVVGRTDRGWLQGHRLEERAFAERRGPNPVTKDDTAALVETEVIVDPLQ